MIFLNLFKGLIKKRNMSNAHLIFFHLTILSTFNFYLHLIGLVENSHSQTEENLSVS